MVPLIWESQESVSRRVGIKRLNGSPRKIEVLAGDFNETVYTILGGRTIGEKTATFAVCTSYAA
jgi:hypothetical protein